MFISQSLEQKMSNGVYNTPRFKHNQFKQSSCTRVGLYIPSSNGNTVNRLRRKRMFRLETSGVLNKLKSRKRIGWFRKWPLKWSVHINA